MAYIYLDDGGPEANEYDSNYVFFNEKDPESWEIVWRHMNDKKTDAATRRLSLQNEIKNHLTKKKTKEPGKSRFFDGLFFDLCQC